MAFLCKFCGKQKLEGEDWLLGIEGSREAGRVMKYTISFGSKWDEQRAQQPNAVYFCSSRCRENYVAKNYGEP